jgi:N-acetyl sugar amidotransferase
LENLDFRICTRCVMDTSDPNIKFDNSGQCNHCKGAFRMLNSGIFLYSEEQKENALKILVTKIKKGKRKNYDCIIGLSGGVDSSYVALIVKQLGLNPLAVHLDNGWNSEIAVQNIENICKNLDIDLYTFVLNWEEFKDLQLAFLRSSTPDSEIPSDHAIHSCMFKAAQKEKVSYVITGFNRSSESILPESWSRGHFDWKYIKSVHKKFGSGKISNFPHYGFIPFVYRWLFKSFVPGIKMINILDYIEYDKNKAKEIIIKDLAWKDYGMKHHESNYTKIYQAYILPHKFGFDKRRAHLSSLICSGIITREQALDELKQSLYDADKLRIDLKYLCNKFEITSNDFQEIMNLPPKDFADYPSYANSLLFRITSFPLRPLNRILKMYRK